MTFGKSLQLIVSHERQNKKKEKPEEKKSRKENEKWNYPHSITYCVYMRWLCLCFKSFIIHVCVCASRYGLEVHSKQFTLMPTTICENQKPQVNWIESIEWEERKKNTLPHIMAQDNKQILDHRWQLTNCVYDRRRRKK